MKPQLASRPPTHRRANPPRTPSARPARTRRRASIGARALAAVALIGGLAAVVIVVKNGGHSASPSPPAAVSHHRLAHSPPRHAAGSTQKGKPQRPRYWTIQTGESFGSIAAKTGIDITKLEELNPKLHPTTLQVGDRVRIR
jgi:hypothetical protein